MISSKFTWRLPDPLPEPIRTALDTYSDPFASILFRRGIESPEQAVQFLLPRQPATPASQQLLHLDRGCQLIAAAVENREPIAVFGDYDADGITATALLTLALRQIADPVHPLIPSRLEDGYGINQQSIDALAEAGIKLLITVDNGIRAAAEIAYANSLGMKVLVTDHHSPGPDLPPAAALINPKIPGDPYPNKHLAGVGVAYKLLSALAAYYPSIHPDDFLDLVAIGTIADIVPLVGENRYLVKKGLQLINTSPRQGLYSLLGTAGLRDKLITAADISFQIAPRLNASGRLGTDDNLAPLELLLEKDPFVCGPLAQMLENHNLQRKNLSKELQERVDSQFADLDPLPPILIALADDIDLGVAGIAAGYLSRKYYLPAIVGQIGQDTTTASCRSIPEFNIVSALESAQDLFTQYGGHKMAAGFTTANENLDLLQQRLQEQARDSFSTASLTPELAIDATVSLADLNHSLYKELSKLEPTGEGNPLPTFACRGLRAKKISTVGAAGEHLKIILSDGNYSMNAIGFGFGHLAADLSGKFDLAFHFTENQYRGKTEFQLQVIDLAAA